VTALSSPRRQRTAARFATRKLEALDSFLAFARGEGLPAWPLELFLEVSNVCDLRCAMCFRFSALNPNRNALIRTESRGFMELEPALEAVSALLPHALVVNVFGYGEPTLHPSFAELIRTLARSEVLVEFFTSGMHLDGPLASLLVEQGVHRVTLSFSGSTREEYESVYLGGDFARVLGNLAALRDHKRAAGGAYPLLEVNSLAFRHHVRSLDRFVELMADHGADQVNVTPLHEHVDSILPLRGHGVPVGSLAGDPVVARAEEVAAGRGVRLRLHPALTTPPSARRLPSRDGSGVATPALDAPATPLNAFPGLARVTRPTAGTVVMPEREQPVDPVRDTVDEVRARLRVTSILGLADQGADFVCLEPFKSLYVRRNGEVKACCYMVDEAPALGHARRTDGASIWAGAGFTAVRHAILGSEYPLASCTYCLLSQEAPPSHGLEIRLADYARWHGERFAPAPELARFADTATELARLGDGRAIADRMAARAAIPLLHPDLLERARRLLAEAGPGHHPDPALLEGYLDDPVGDVLSGWVWSPRYPELHFPVALIEGGHRLEERAAHGFRADLTVAGKGDGTYAFAFPVEATHHPLQRLEVRLGDSPWRLTVAGVTRCENR